MTVAADPGTHRVTRADFAALASGHGGGAVVARLKRGQQSRRLLIIRALLDSTPDALGDGMRAGLALLDDVSGIRPDISAKHLLHPHTGAWVVHCLRVVRGAAASDVPLETDLGYLAAIAASAAIRAGLGFSIQIPARDGIAHLPTLGAARVRPAATSVQILSDDSGVVVDGRKLPTTLSREDTGWLPLRRLYATADDLALELELDDLDPFRNCCRLAAAERLTDAAAAIWQRRLQEAWPLLVQHHRHYAEAIAVGLGTIVPLVESPSSRGVNATSMDSFGATLMSPPADPEVLAVSMVHEFQHAKLGALLNLLQLHDANPQAHYYAPWRDDPRPFGGLFQGAYAYLGVTDFWRVQRSLPTAGHADFAQFEFVRWRERVDRVLEVIANSGRLTEAGRDFVAGMVTTVDGWRDEPVGADTRALARDAADDHHIGWRLRNLLPDPAQVRQLAKAWLAGDAPPLDGGGPSDLLPSDSRALVHNVRLDLLGLRISDRGRFDRLLRDPTALVQVAPEATDGDVAYARGDYAAAIHAYRELIAASPAQRRNWAGLALALRRLGASPAATALVRHPELVYAVYCLLADQQAAPAPDELADWLAGAAAPAQITGRSGQGVDGSTNREL